MKKYSLMLFPAIMLLLYSCYQESYIPVEAKFTTSYLNNDESIPVYIKIENLSKGADAYEWTFEGGTPETSSDKNPKDIFYSLPGIYKIKLTASNIDGEIDEFEQQFEIKDAINITFRKEIIQSNYPPVEVKFINETEGVGLTYLWKFEDGIPNFSSEKNPENVIFPNPGVHLVSLTVSNGFESFIKTDSVVVKENIITSFEWETAWEDYDYQVPVKLIIQNESENAINYQWTFQGGNPSISTVDNPEVVYSQPGTYQITLIASNGKTTQTLQKQVTVFPDSGIYILEDVKLGINYAHNTNTFGAFYSTKLRKSFTDNQITTDIAPLIDIAFQGQNSTFTFNKFISPTDVNQYGFAPIPNATKTLFINSQEICNCGLNVSEAQFNAVTNATPLQNLSIPNSIAGQQQFGNGLPRIVLFKNQDGRKGIIKIKQFVSAGNNQSYILCDIKVQK